MSGSGCLREHEPGAKNCGLTHQTGLLVKSASLKASKFVVSVITYDLSDEMLKYYGGTRVVPCLHSYEPIFWGSGFILECDDAGDGIYSGTILTAATLFKRTNDIQPNDIKVEVYLVDGKQVEAELICCDFHYNLASIRVQSSSQLPIASLRCMDDVLSLNPSELLRSHEQHSFQLRPYSHLTKILPGELVIALGSYYCGEGLLITPGFFSEKASGHGCSELYGAYCCTP